MTKIRSKIDIEKGIVTREGVLYPLDELSAARIRELALRGLAVLLQREPDVWERLKGNGSFRRAGGGRPRKEKALDPWREAWARMEASVQLANSGGTVARFGKPTPEWLAEIAEARVRAKELGRSDLVGLKTRPAIVAEYAKVLAERQEAQSA